VDGRSGLVGEGGDRKGKRGREAFGFVAKNDAIAVMGTMNTRSREKRSRFQVKTTTVQREGNENFRDQKGSTSGSEDLRRELRNAVSGEKKRAGRRWGEGEEWAGESREKEREGRDTAGGYGC